MDRTLSLREARDSLGQRVDEAHFKDEHTIITKNGHPRAVLISFEHYQAMNERLGQPGAEPGADLDPSSSDAISTDRAESTG